MLAKAVDKVEGQEPVAVEKIDVQEKQVGERGGGGACPRAMCLSSSLTCTQVPYDVPVENIIVKDEVKEVPVDRLNIQEITVPVDRILVKEVPIPIDRIIEQTVVAEVQDVPVEKIVVQEIPVPVDKIVIRDVEVKSAAQASRDVATRCLWRGRWNE
eukprot:768513-Hanusia_phi.AAC.9